MKSMIVLLVLCVASFSALAVETNKAAPDFDIISSTSAKSGLKLSSYKGKVVVLEWLNHGCPFVRKHYDTGNMQALQKKYTAKNVVWLSVISSAPGKQGHVNIEEAKADAKKNNAGASDIILDADGKIGMLYGAKTTPHMYVINKEGILVYQGAIDDKPDADKESVAGAKNYVAEALDSVLAGKPVIQATTKSYGCGVKY